MYSYTISKTISNTSFKKACAYVESFLKLYVKEPLLIDVDGSTSQTYIIAGGKITVSNDCEVDAVYIDSDVDLGEIWIRTS